MKKTLIKFWCENGATYERLTRHIVKGYLPKRPIIQGGSYKPDEHGKKAYYAKYNLTENEKNDLMRLINKEYHITTFKTANDPLVIALYKAK